MTMAASEIWPPAYTVRISSRAKCARLRVLPGKGLEVVLPRNLDPATATEIVERHRDWVCKTLEKVCGKDAHNTSAHTVPQWIHLDGGADARQTVCKGETATDAARAVTLRAARHDTRAAAKELQEWARQYAIRALGNETALLADRHEMPYSALRFRRQKSRWGSCTANGALSLNICLIFLPLDLARHVIMHELAHTRHMNHGQGFWKALFAMEPDALKLDRRLRTAWRFVPEWMWM